MAKFTCGSVDIVSILHNSVLADANGRRQCNLAFRYIHQTIVRYLSKFLARTSTGAAISGQIHPQ